MLWWRENAATVGEVDRASKARYVHCTHFLRDLPDYPIAPTFTEGRVRFVL